MLSPTVPSIASRLTLPFSIICFTVWFAKIARATSLLSACTDSEKENKLFENQELLILPICRNGKDKATFGLDTKEWESWKN